MMDRAQNCPTKTLLTAKGNREPSWFTVEQLAATWWRSKPKCSTWNISSTDPLPLSNVPRETSCILESPLLDFRWRGIIWQELSRSQIKRAEWAKQPPP